MGVFHCFSIKDVSTCSNHLEDHHDHSFQEASRPHKGTASQFGVRLTGQRSTSQRSNVRSTGIMLWAKVVKLMASNSKRIREVRERLDTQNTPAPRIRFVLVTVTRVGLRLHNLMHLGLRNVCADT